MAQTCAERSGAAVPRSMDGVGTHRSGTHRQCDIISSHPEDGIDRRWRNLRRKDQGHIGQGRAVMASCSAAAWQSGRDGLKVS